MPRGLADAVLCDALHRKTKTTLTPHDASLARMLEDFDELPFLSIESDGSPFPQILEAKLEAFCLRALRLHDRMSRR
jgi:hypothetical protein